MSREGRQSDGSGAAGGLSGHPGFWIAGTLVVILLLAGFSLFRLSFDEKITSMLPENDPEVAKFSFVMENIPMTDAFYVDIQAASPAESDRRSAIRAADSLYDTFRNSGYFTGIIYRFPAEQFLRLFRTVTDHAPLLTTPADLQKIAARTRPESLELAIRRIKRQILEPGGSLAALQLLSDPVGIDGILMEKLKAIDDRYRGVTVREGRIWSADGRHILMIATPDFPAADTLRGEALIRFADAARQSAVSPETSTKPTISYAGAHVATFDNASVIERDVKRALSVLSLVIMLLGLLFFRNRYYVLLLFIPTAFSLAAASAIIALFDSEVSAMAFGCGSVLAGITVDFGVHLLYMMDNVSHKERHKACGRLLFPLSMGAATTVSAFLCLTLSALPGQRQMGLFAALAVSSAALFSIFLLKRCVPCGRGVVREPVISLVGICRRFLLFSEKWRWGLLFCAALVIGLSATGIGKFRFEGELSKLNGLSRHVQEDFDRVIGTWGSFSPSLAIVRGDTLQAALEKNDALHPVLFRLQEEGEITTFSGVSAMLPARRTQMENLGNWQRFWDGAKKRGFEGALSFAGSAEGFAAGSFDPFIRRIDRVPAPLTPSDYRDTAVSSLIGSKVVEGVGKNLVLTTFYPTSRGAVGGVTEKIVETVPGALVLDRGNFVSHCASLVQKEFGKIAVGASIAILFCLYFFLRRGILVLAVILPVATSVFVTLGILGHLGIAVNLISMLFIVFIFGVGVDFSIFLLSCVLKDDGDEHQAITCGAVVICALTTMGGFATLVFAEHPALFSIGAAGFIGMVSCLAAALIFIPAMGRRLKAAELLRRRPGALGLTGLK